MFPIKSNTKLSLVFIELGLQLSLVSKSAIKSCDMEPEVAFLVIFLTSKFSLNVLLTNNIFFSTFCADPVQV